MLRARLAEWEPSAPLAGPSLIEYMADLLAARSWRIGRGEPAEAGAWQQHVRSTPRGRAYRRMRHDAFHWPRVRPRDQSHVAAQLVCGDDVVAYGSGPSAPRPYDGGAWP